MNLNRLLRGALTTLVTATAFCVSPSLSAALTNSNNTPFSSSPVITAAHWASLRHGPPRNQWGDILATSWADDDNLYTVIDDGGTDSPRPGELWRNSLARITGAPLRNLRFRRVGKSPPPATWSQIHRNRSLWSGPLGSFYSTGFTAVNHVFYATQVNDWNWNANGPFNGLAGIAYSTNHGVTWNFPSQQFPAPTGNLNWVQRGRDNTPPDGYVYAISTEREFNASTLLLSRSRPDITDMTNPARWQWAAGWRATPSPWPHWSGSASEAQPIIDWPGHITYPRMSWDPGIHRYLLTFTYSFASTPPGIWKNGSELVILDAPYPWGPFTFVARGNYFGPSNGYDPAIPAKWISDHGRTLWMVWAANFDGCAGGLNCSGAYGFNYQRIQLTVAGSKAAAAQTRKRLTTAARTARPAPPASWRSLPATPPRYKLPRLLLSH